MNPDRQPFSVLAARLQAQKPWLSWSQVCSELAKRPRRNRKILTVRKSAPPLARQWWQD